MDSESTKKRLRNNEESESDFSSKRGSREDSVSSSDGTKRGITQILIPSGHAGAVIGKKGVTIKSLSTSSGCRIQLQEEGIGSRVKERVLTISSSTLPQMIDALRLLITNFEQDARNYVFASLHTAIYAAENSLGSSGYQPSAAPLQYDPYSQQYYPAYPQVINQPLSGNYLPHGHGGGNGYPLDPNSVAYAQPPAAPYYAPNQPLPTGTSGVVYQPPKAGEYAPQLYPETSPYFTVTLDGHASAAPYPPSNPSAGVLPALGEFPAHLHGMGVTPPKYSTTTGDRITMEIGVPDNLIGTVMGRGGEIIRDIKSASGASIQISQKGVYIPGTSNRGITASGRQYQVQEALRLIYIRLSTPQPSAR